MFKSRHQLQVVANCVAFATTFLWLIKVIVRLHGLGEEPERGGLQEGGEINWGLWGNGGHDKLCPYEGQTVRRATIYRGRRCRGRPLDAASRRIGVSGHRPLRKGRGRGAYHAPAGGHMGPPLPRFNQINKPQFAIQKFSAIIGLRKGA